MEDEDLAAIVDSKEPLAITAGYQVGFVHDEAKSNTARGIPCYGSPLGHVPKGGELGKGKLG